MAVKADGGTLIVLQTFDAFARLDSKTACTILDIIAGQSRVYSLLGLRLVALVQSDDPAINFDPVGACPVMCNPKEWLRSPKGL